MDGIWHRVLGLSGNYYLGNNKDSLVIALLTYKRVNDIVNMNDEMTKECIPRVIVRDQWSWNTVKNRKDITLELEQAIEGINYDNYVNLVYGTTLIPTICKFNEYDEKYVNEVITQWFDILERRSFAFSSLSESEWYNFITYQRKRLKR